MGIHHDPLIQADVNRPLHPLFFELQKEEWNVSNATRKELLHDIMDADTAADMATGQIHPTTDHSSKPFHQCLHDPKGAALPRGKLRRATGHPHSALIQQFAVPHTHEMGCRGAQYGFRAKYTSPCAPEPLITCLPWSQLCAGQQISSYKAFTVLPVSKVTPPSYPGPPLGSLPPPHFRSLSNTTSTTVPTSLEGAVKLLQLPATVDAALRTTMTAYHRDQRYDVLSKNFNELEVALLEHAMVLKKQRNALRELNEHQPIDRRQPPTLTPEARKANAAKLAEREEELRTDIKQLLDEFNERIGHLSKKHSKKPDYFRTCLYLTSKAEKQTRKVNSFNAFTHLTLGKENADLPVGSKLSLIEGVKSGLKKYEELTKTEKDELVKALEAHREGKEKGFRVTAKSRAQIIRNATQQVNQMLLNMKEATGVSAIVFTARNNTSVEYKPHFYGTDQASKDFVRLCLKKDIMDLSCQYEGYLISNLEGAASNRQTRLTRVRANCTRLIIEGFDDRFELEGWPLQQFRSPASISSMEQLEQLEEALENEDCVWIQLSNEELTERKKELDVLKEARSKKRKAAEGKGPASKKRRISADTIVDSDSDDGEDAQSSDDN
ncbi:hypothetical protein M422DRAFT_251089 [Sphaerobolus stellatus SS14]|uniref:Uncharacterized protein n=1 Tax=Sphaerobolus stellatus (strain SS14) TaxID=990650 RepID=A0A0C9VS76_SPHS4|nr:hypothetical protein M422DRAFT_251089 [Sphaerobolus stellatus SS14]